LCWFFFRLLSCQTIFIAEIIHIKIHIVMPAFSESTSATTQSSSLCAESTHKVRTAHHRNAGRQMGRQPAHSANLQSTNPAAMPVQPCCPCCPSCAISSYFANQARGSQLTSNASATIPRLHSSPFCSKNSQKGLI